MSDVLVVCEMGDRLLNTLAKPDSVTPERAACRNCCNGMILFQQAQKDNTHMYLYGYQYDAFTAE